ncbi:hypothetical protein [Salipiger sp.]|uniref:hypothetical protein n=1 Tax=Salipiger sp. TaxID=2078585 RepID=UPI003A970DB7
MRSELDRIERQRRVSAGSAGSTRWAHPRKISVSIGDGARLVASGEEGLHLELSAHDRRTLLNEGSNEADIASLETMLGVLSRDVLSEAGVK